MMNSRKRLARAAAALLSGALATGLCGCGFTSRVELKSFNDPYFPETFFFSPSVCAYRYDAGGDRHIVAYAGGEAESGEAATQQWLHVHIFWHPRPGKTRDNPTSMDATVRYVVKTPKGVTHYSGTAFVYARSASVGEGLIVDLESGRMHLDEADGSTADMLGETRLRGKLEARLDANTALDLQRQMALSATVED